MIVAEPVISGRMMGQHFYIIIRTYICFKYIEPYGYREISKY